MSLPPSASCFVFSQAGTPQQAATVPLDVSTLEPGELLVRVDAATVCGSDVHTADGKRVDPAAPLVLGHEGCGTVVAGSAESGSPRIAAGPRVTWSVMASCGACAPCARLGLPQKCATALHKYGHAGFGTGGALRDEYSPVEAPRPKRWWAEPCSHSMQEVAFIAWMDVAFNGTAWRWALPVWQVETFYAWWTVSVWPDLAGTR
jgi:threonine dehydrogenase-like Zn-dependent dehydrogenase